MSAHLRDADVEALAHGREMLAGDGARAHARACDACAARVALARSESRQLGDLLAASSPAIDDEELAVLAMRAIDRAGVAQPPSRRAIVSAAALGTVVLTASAVLSFRGVPTAHGVLGALHEGLHASVALDRLVRALLPGGWGTLAFVAAVVALGTTWPLLRLARGLVAVPGRAVLLAGSIVALVVGVGTSGRARALEFAGDWPPGERVTLTASHSHLSQVLSRAAEGAGLGYVGTLESDPEVTVSVRGAPLREFLAALLGDAPLLVDHEPGMLVVRPTAASATPATPGTAPPAPPTPGTTPPMPPTPGTAPTTPTVPPIAGLAPPTPPTPPAPPLPPAVPGAESEARDRFTFGGDIVVREGERVRSVVTMGGDAEIRGEVLGDVTSMGGDIHVARGGIVRGELVSMGGEIRVDEGANVPPDGVRAQLGTARTHRHGHRTEASPVVPESAGARALARLGETVGDVTGHLARYALLFLVGLMLLSLAPRRFAEVTATLRAAPLRALAVGALAFVAAVALFVVLVISLVGIPAALVVAVATALAGYAGLAAVACVVGAALPLTPLAGKPLAQLGAGTGTLLVVSLVPFFGGLAVFAAVLAGAGAVVLTRGGRRRASVPPPAPIDDATRSGSPDASHESDTTG